MAGKKRPSAVQDNTKAGVGFEVLPDKEHDVAWAYAILSGGTVPPVIRGDDVEEE